MRNKPLEPYSWPEEPLFCAHCGTTIAADDLFCPRCGQKIERKAASPGWGWYIGLLLLAIALLLCILGIGALGAYHGLEERYRLNQGAALYKLSSQMTGHQMAILCAGEPGLIFRTDLHGVGTTRMEPAARGRVDRTGDLAFGDDMFPSGSGVGDGHG
ncbi:MAG TPA: hypothetical protein DCP08_07755 [Chloroflexi bacterium]|nr:hypothetical protein [Chloroflexota bacterium]